MQKAVEQNDGRSAYSFYWYCVTFFSFNKTETSDGETASVNTHFTSHALNARLQDPFILYLPFCGPNNVTHDYTNVSTHFHQVFENFCAGTNVY